MRDVILRMTGKQKALLYEHLFPHDGMEAVALLLCGRHSGANRHALSVMELVSIPYAVCDRQADRITWPTDRLLALLKRAAKDGLALVKIHSHPGGYDRFSEFDDFSDAEFFEATASWTESDEPHGSLVALPCGRLFGRYADGEGCFRPLDMISVAGESIEYWTEDESGFVPDFADRHAQVLGDKTIGTLRRLKCAVVGCSGTGSPTVEQLFRLGIGELLLIDPDTIGPENLNRIINSKHLHAQSRTAKVNVLANAILDTDIGTTVSALAEDLCAPDVARQVASCDIIFGCVDSIFARHLLNKIASTYCIPYIDVGVGIKADGNGGVSHVTGAVHYLQPDGSSLMSRGVFTPDDVQADALQRSDPAEFERRLDSGYIKGAAVSRPAVMPVNIMFSGLAVYEFLCRLHPLRDEGNAEYANQRWSLSNGLRSSNVDGDRCMAVSRHLGRGDMVPLIGMPQLSDVKGHQHEVR